ncbi:MAG: sugar transferase [Candidatus Scalindua sp.]|nr:sugar transferase [Candidatus Scalindua sp.]
MRKDIRYVRQQSLWFDINILKKRVVSRVSRIKDDFFSRSVYVTAKPRIDSFLAISGIILFLPLIKITSKGPVFYSQERVGINGKIFEIIKFRTMHFNAEDEFGPTWAKKNDPRITLLGRILRKTHIDELPQFVNVIQGDMSIVGPRPERPHFVNKFIKDIPGYTNRLTVKPGITGLAQCYYKYDETLRDVEKKIQYDTFYIKKMSWLLDFKILLLTLRVSLFGEMQYRDQGM